MGTLAVMSTLRLTMTEFQRIDELLTNARNLVADVEPRMRLLGIGPTGARSIRKSLDVLRYQVAGEYETKEFYGKLPRS